MTRKKSMMKYRIKLIMSCSLTSFLMIGCTHSLQKPQDSQGIDEILFNFATQEMAQVPQTTENGKISLIKATRTTILIQALENDGSLLDALNQLKEEGLIEFTDISTENGIEINSIYGLFNGVNQIRQLYGERKIMEFLTLKEYKEVYTNSYGMKWKVFTTLTQKDGRFYTYGLERTFDVDNSSIITTESYVPINKLPFIASNYYVLDYELDTQEIIKRQLQEEENGSERNSISEDSTQPKL